MFACKRPDLITVLTLVALILYGCGGDKPDRSNPYGEMSRGLRDKEAHRKGYGFND